MSRPGLIVGLGGTGQWVLTWLKRDLLTANNGVMPDNIKLLAIDTATQLEAGAERVTASGTKEEGAEVGGVTLDKSKGEFIYIGGNARPLAEEVRDGQWPQIDKWFQARNWLASQAPAVFILDDGAGRIRQFGRLAVYKDVIGRQTGSVTWRAFRSAIQNVQTRTSENRRLEIVVVGSFAGGTGSGMFLDVALILRMLAQQLGVHHVLRGFFALPSVFTNAPDADMQARTFAAWRELNRFMVVNPDFPMPLIEYVENDPQFRIRPDQRIFDACYLIDGKRKDQPLAEEAKYGVFPMMAEVISAILDESAGQAYTQWIMTNLAPEYAKNPETPMYSAIGAYTVQVPAHFVQEASSHDLSQKLLLQLLQPRQAPDKFGQLASSGAQRHLALATPDNNQEDRGFAGSQRAHDFFTTSAEYSGQAAKPTLFLGRIATLNEDATGAGRWPAVVERLARAGGAAPGKAGSGDSWVTYLPDLGDDPNFVATQKHVEEFTRFRVPTAFARGEKESVEEFHTKLRKIPDTLRVKFGGLTSSGEEVETFYGEFGDALQEIQRVQLIIFRNLLRLRLSDILMGRSDNALVARSGKLGYARDYFNGVAADIDQFVRLMADVRSRRNEIKNEIKLAGLSKRAEQMMMANANKRLFWLWEHPSVRGSEDEYLKAQDRLMDVRREDILHVFVRETAEMMKRLVEEARDALDGWIRHLATGDTASALPGLWDGILASKRSVESAHGYDTRTPKVQQLLQDVALVADDAEVAKALSRWQWVVNYGDGQPSRLQLTALITPEAEGQPIETLADPNAVAGAEVRTDLGRRNQSRLLNLARRSYSGVVARSRVTDAIRERYPDPLTFAKSVAQVSAEPLFIPASGGNARRKSNLIRVMADEKDNYFGVDGLVGALRESIGLNRDKLDDTYGIQLVGSEHPYKLTLVRTDDLYNYNDFAAWRTAQNDYISHITGDGTLMDPTLLHNFAAEANAVNLERRLRSLDASTTAHYRPLHPRVVMLLEEPRAVRQFLYLGMLGLIGEEGLDDGLYRWELTWAHPEGAQTFWLTKSWNKDADSGRRVKPDILNAMHGYAIMRRTLQPGYTTVINHGYAERLIKEMVRDSGDEVQLLEANLAHDGIVSWLHGLAMDPAEPEKILRQDFEDISQVARLMLRERLGELRGGPGGRKPGSSPFKVLSDLKATQAKSDGEQTPQTGVARGPGLGRQHSE